MCLWFPAIFQIQVTIITFICWFLMNQQVPAVITSINLFINFIMSIYSRNADPILKLVAITPRTFFWLRFFLFNFPSFWKTFAMKTELVVYFSSVTKQMNIYSRKADPILNLPTNTPRTFFWLRFFLFNFPSFWDTFVMKTELVVYFPSVTKQLTKETYSSKKFRNLNGLGLKC